MSERTDSANLYDLAAKALKEHELKHYPLKRAYEISLDELQRLNRASSDAWRNMNDAMERERAK